MKFNVIIPARIASTRFPEKVLANLAGRPMIAHTVGAALQSGATTVTVAGDDPRVLECAQNAGAATIATGSAHRSGTDRLAEAVVALGLDDDAVVVNVQGDEPLIPPALIDQVANALFDAPSAAIATAATPIDDRNAWQDPNIVKVVRDPLERGLYFSRAPIPHARDANDGWPGQALRHIGIYAYRVRALKTFTAAKPGALEQLESLEQLRAFDIGLIIRVVTAIAVPGPGVDTPTDLARVEQRLEGEL